MGVIMRKREILLLLAILAGILAVGFAVNVGSFADNILASGADVIVGIFIALFLVDRIARRERARKWERVKALTYHSIESVCDLIMFTFLTETSTGMGKDLELAKALLPSKQKPPYEAFLELGEDIGNELDKPFSAPPIVVDPRLRERYPVPLSETRDGVIYVADEQHARQYRDERQHKISSQCLLSSVSPNFEKLSFHIFPRIFELDEQEELITSLIEVESAFQEWESTVDTIEGDWGMPDEYAWRAVAQFCQRVREMLRVIYLTKHEPERTHQNERATGSASESRASDP
jgi:hypothetical protein